MSVQEKKIDEMTFREAMTELEGIVRQLESGALELEESLDLYARGVKLLSALQGKLASAELRIESLLGELKITPEDMARDTTLS